jgi:hypothetical protein
MKKKLLVIIVLSVCLIVPNLCLAQNNDIVLEAANKRPDLAIDIVKSAELKIAVRKNIYSIGEMLILDIAMLNLGQSNDIYLPPIKKVELTITNQKGQSILIPYFLKTASQSVASINQNRLETDLVMLLIGCTERPFQVNSELSNEYNSENVFAKNLFLTWGDACLDVKNKSKIKIVAQIENNLVLVTNQKPILKTAVGKLVSNNLNLSVIR